MSGKTLKLISLNISRKNPFGGRIVRLVHKKRPDIVCLQEVLQGRIDRLKNLGYTTGQTEDYQHVGKKSGYIATGVTNKSRVISVEKARYYDAKITAAPWQHVYGKVAKLRERHEGLVTTIRVHGKLLRIVNLHLSTACGPRVRIAQLTRMLHKFADGKTIFCGDFNIVSDMFFKIVAGWACGYKLSDYFFDERAEVNKIIKSYGLQNPFAKKTTTTYPFFFQQLDHILVPEGIKITKKRMFRVPLSDHKALQVEFEF